ncbi:unnamed protein product [Trypanosoma congolense IL3000]|uniref:WGS project CAEQ00000000 data, annotated contig 1148 n=1 Tax=Trypanosoma congolense (strain IL3000) TaxID=1068625 RepID=F9W458_TRYCI|nr:unnamed protein product [Trypanosoma congolense IL3000]
MVFENARNESVTPKFSLEDGEAATPEQLKDCFSGNYFREESLVNIDEKSGDKKLNVDSEIEGIKYNALRSHFTGSSTTEACCNLINRDNGGIIWKTYLEKSLWCGGEILTMSKKFSGDLETSTNLIACEIANITVSKATWTADPAKQIVHLKNVSEVFKAFKIVQRKNKVKVESNEQKIQVELEARNPVRIAWGKIPPNRQQLSKRQTHKPASVKSLRHPPI